MGSPSVSARNILFLLGLSIASPPAGANEDPILLPPVLDEPSGEWGIVPFAPAQTKPPALKKSDSEVFTWLEAAFRKMGMPIPVAPLFADVEKTLGEPSSSEATSSLPFFLVGDAFRNPRFLSWDVQEMKTYSNGRGLSAEYGLRFRTLPDKSFVQESRVPGLAQSRPLLQPLAGFRIAIDPGHMGGSSWDKITGKFIVDTDGKKLSEGTMALQTSILLKKSFEALGASVLLTHEDFDAVTSVKMQNLDLQDWAFRELRNASGDAWLTALAQTAKSSDDLANLILKSSQYKRYASEIMRGTYHTQRLDLQTRNEVMEAFDPDLILVIHFDVAVTAASPNGVNRKGKQGVKAYVPGAFSESELATPERRAHFLKAFSKTSVFAENVKFAKFVTTAISRKMKIPFDPVALGTAVSHGSGVQSRNLTLTHSMTRAVGAFLECAYYNTSDFDRFVKADYSMTIDGVKTTYSKRLVEVADSIRDGVLDYVGSFSGPSLVK